MDKAVLYQQLAAFDGKQTGPLVEVMARHGEDADYLDVLIDAMGKEDSALNVPASWLVLEHLKAGGAITSDQTQLLFATLNLQREWPFLLHVCQSVQHLSVARKSADAVWPLLVRLSEHDRPFVRAWSLDALFRIAIQHGDPFAASATGLIGKGCDDDKASVRKVAQRHRQALRSL